MENLDGPMGNVTENTEILKTRYEENYCTGFYI